MTQEVGWILMRQASFLVEQGKLPFRGDERQNLILVPGNITLHAEDIWDSFKEPDHEHFDFHFKNIKRLSESDTIFINTFEELESAALESMRSDVFAANIKVGKKTNSLNPSTAGSHASYNFSWI
jgi:hypothetical protein